MNATSDLVLALERYEAGNLIELVVEREGDQVNIPITLEEAQ